MDNLKTILDSKDLEYITDKIQEFFAPAQGYGNKLKLSIAVATIITESLSLLNGINTESFISDLKNKLDKIESDAVESKAVHMDHLRLNKEVRSGLCEDSNSVLKVLERDLKDDLDKMDKALKDLLAVREKMSISEVVDKERHV